MPVLSPSELILNEDGSIYHLHLRPEHIADTILTVGDPGRVPLVSRYFDEIEFRIQKREFITHTGRLGKRRLTVISTGIGPDNMDIVLNELDALVNIDLVNRSVHTEKKQLDFIRVGTCGGLQKQHPPGTLISSAYAVGLDNLLFFYPDQAKGEASGLNTAFQEAFPDLPILFYTGKAHPSLLADITGTWDRGITLTLPGFYAPQGRKLRLGSRISPDLLERFAGFSYDGYRITNFEMETSALFSLAQLLGHRAISCNVVLANRRTGTFSEDPAKDIDKLIRKVLEKL